jgi:hypothetical protein
VEGILETLLGGVRAAADGFGVVPGERAGWVGVVPLRERVSNGKSSMRRVHSQLWTLLVDARDEQGDAEWS